METNEKMVLSMVKEQLNYYHRIKKVECKYLAWWKLHEGQISYVVFVVQQILMVVKSQIKAKVFNIVIICTNIQYFPIGDKKTSRCL
jgi:hypothetical protein